jgi:hexokinase
MKVNCQRCDLATMIPATGFSVILTEHMQNVDRQSCHVCLKGCIEGQVRLLMATSFALQGTL